MRAETGPAVGQTVEVRVRRGYKRVKGSAGKPGRRPLRRAHPDRAATCRSDQAAVVEHEELIGPVEGDFAM